MNLFDELNKMYGDDIESPEDKNGFIIPGNGRCFVGDEIWKTVEGRGKVLYEVLSGGRLREVK